MINHCIFRNLKAFLYGEEHYSNSLHLYYCKEFECPFHFKCPESYCIPIKHRCDSEQDCPFGEDEEHCTILTCSGLFWCPVDKLCLSYIEICDGITNCPLTKEDELFCNIKSCPKLCFCVGYGIHCINSSLKQVPILGRTATTLILRNNNINFFIAQDPYEDNLKKKSILFAGLLKLNFWLLGRSTTWDYSFNTLAFFTLRTSTSVQVLLLLDSPCWPDLSCS